MTDHNSAATSAAARREAKFMKESLISASAAALT
jgi:hypothetical protein